MPKRKSHEAKPETRHIDDLKAFPDQAAVFDDLSPDDLQKLAEDIREHGLKEPVHVLPRNAAGFPVDAVLDGHQRLAALRLLGHSEVSVLVRFDLADATREAIEMQFAGPNLHRRHFSALQRLRAWLYYYERQYGIKIEEPSTCTDEEFLGGARQCAGTSCRRHLQRLLKILELPLELQRCVDDGRLRMTYAERVKRMSEGEQQQIIARIEAGEEPNAVVSDCLPGQNSPVRLDKAVKATMYKLLDINGQLGPRIGELDEFGNFYGIDCYRQTIAAFQQLLIELDAGLQRAQQS